jgi:hypothetical protein
MPKKNAIYYGARASEERLAAEASKDPRAGAAHSELAARYEALSGDPSIKLPAPRKATWSRSEL